MNIIKRLIPEGSPARPGTGISSITSITLHWIGAFPGQTVNDPWNYWVNRRLQCSAHYVVKNDDVLQAIPITEVAYHCGKPEGNLTSIGIEVVPCNIAGEFNKVTIATLKELFVLLPDVPLMRHYDWTKKDCPRFYTPHVEGGDIRWAQLVKELGRETV